MGLVQELRYAARSLRATPLFTLASVTILALGIGATSAVFSVVNGLLLEPLPVRDPGRLVRIWKNNVKEGFEHLPISYPEYLYWEERTELFDSLAALWSKGATEGIWKVDGEAKRLRIELVSANFFDVLGVAPVHGRGFVPADEDRTSLPPIVLSYELFRSRFGEDPSVLGQTQPVVFGEIEHVEVVGVLPPGFHLSTPADVYAPTRALLRDWHNGTGCECDLIGRVRSGASIGSARAELQTINDQYADEDPSGRSRPLAVATTPLLDTIVGGAGTASLVLFGAACLLLVIATVNLAGLFVTRTAKRQRELAVRAAIGADHSTLVRQLLAESLLIAAVGLVGGLCVASWGVELLLSFSGTDLPRTDQIEIDRFVLGFSALLAVAATFGFGLWPALQASRLDLVHSLKGKTVGFVNTRLVGRLVVVEIAMAFVLVAASSLLVRSLVAAQSIERGFRTNKLVSIGIDLPGSKYPEVNDRMAFHRRLRDEVEALPGIAGASSAKIRPGGADFVMTGVFRLGGQTEEEAFDNPRAAIEWVSPSYFRVMGIPFVRGRAFTDADRLESELVAIVSESIAETYWPGEDPIGKTFGSRPSRIVGVVADTRFRELRRSWDSIYFSLEQNPFSDATERHPLSVPNYLLVHTMLDSEDVLASILGRIRAVDPDIPLDDVVEMEVLLNRELTRARFHAFLGSSFSLVGLLLALTGIYGVIASFVAQRRPELGLRLALGATPSRLRVMVLARALRMSAVGLLVGIAFALPSLRLVRSLLYGVSTYDIPSYLGVASALAVVSLAAAYLPAYGASRADPMSLLRSE